MKFTSLVIWAAALCAVLFLLGIEYRWPRFLFYCESFGCSAMGMAYLIYAAVIVAVFTLAGALLGPRPRTASALFAGGVATMAMFLVFGALLLANQMRIAKGMAAHDAACRQYPQLCPERTAPSQPARQPEALSPPARP